MSEAPTGSPSPGGGAIQLEAGATNQFNQMAREGKLVPFDQRQPGDLLFWNDTTGQWPIGHVAIYGGPKDWTLGWMIQASPGSPVTGMDVWSSDGGEVLRTDFVGRPSL